MIEEKGWSQRRWRSPDHAIGLENFMTPFAMTEKQPEVRNHYIFKFLLIYFKCFGCAGSSLLGEGSLSLQGVGATLCCT